MTRIQRLLDHIYMTRARAIELGYDHEGTLFGVPVWCEYDEARDYMGNVATKFVPFELLIDIGTFILQAANAFRPPGDEYMFPFHIRPIRQESE